MEKIIIKNLSKQYEERKVLNRLNLVLEGGSPNCIMGASGCGKSTLLNILLGILRADEGEILIEEKGKIKPWIPEALHPSVVFQEDRLCEEFFALSNLMMVMRGKESRGEQRRKCMKLLSALGLEEFMHTRVSKLSGGQKRRVAIARALAYEAELFIMDEPFRGLDSENKLLAMQLVKEMTRKKTLIIVTHENEEADFFGKNQIKI